MSDQTVSSRVDEYETRITMDMMMMIIISFLCKRLYF